MLSPTLPWPPHMGSRIRILHILKELSSAHRVTLVAPAAEETALAQSWRSLCSELHTVPAGPTKTLAAVRTLVSRRPYRAVKFCTSPYRRLVARLLQAKSFDLIWVNYMELMDCLPSQIRPRPAVVLDQPNDEREMWLSFSRKGNWAFRVFARQNLRKICRLENRVCNRLDAVIAVSQAESERLRRRLPETCLVWTFPNGVDAEYFHSPHRPVDDQACEILFCGSLDIAMNTDAVLYFAAQIFPHIRRSIPAVTFRIVGRNPPRRIRRLGNRRGIVVTGTVSDVRPYYDRAAVAVSPFRMGAGTKLKILEAMAMGVPLVSTSVGVQGVRISDGEHMFIEDQPQRFAQRVKDLLQDGRLRRDMASRAREWVVQEYSWPRVLAGLRTILARVSEGGEGSL